MAFTIALVVFWLALLAARIFRNRPWSRTLAILATAICTCMTLFIFPHIPVALSDNTVDLSHKIADILGRSILAAMMVSSVQLRFIWQKPESPDPRPKDPEDGFLLYP